jgi:hypothetical protein
LVASILVNADTSDGEFVIGKLSLISRIASNKLAVSAPLYRIALSFSSVVSGGFGGKGVNRSIIKDKAADGNG